jgi:hypothetical protein
LGIKTIIIDLAAILIIYFLLEISDLTNIPFYSFEPMRIVIIIALVYTSEKNAYLLAVLLPLVSFVLSNHPSVAKTFILAGDFLLNILLFFLFKRKYNVFLAMAYSIILSKMAYYFAKFLLIKFILIQGELISTPIFTQLIIIVVLSTYTYLAKNSMKSIE